MKMSGVTAVHLPHNRTESCTAVRRISIYLNVHNSQSWQQLLENFSKESETTGEREGDYRQRNQSGK